MPHSRIDFKTATIKDLQELLCKGEVTSVQLVTSYLVRTGYQCDKLLQMLISNSVRGI